uniref:Uncharacterized protein n=1 Tax=Cannabis sativa TaxID=3483 RepID=A0A803PA18_CANSA
MFVALSGCSPPLVSSMHVILSIGLGKVIAAMETRGRVRIVEGVTQPHIDVDPGVDHAKVPKVDQGAESPDIESEVEEAAPGPSVGIVGTLSIERACPSDGQVHDLVDDVPLSLIAQNFERRERALCRCLVCGGSVGDASLRIMPRGQSSEGPSFPLPTFRGKSKMIVEDIDNYFYEDDDVSSRLRGLTGGPSNEPSGQLRAKVAQTTHGSITGQRAIEAAHRFLERAIPSMDEELYELGDGELNRLYSTGLQDLFVALMKLSSSRDSSPRKKENTTKAATISRLEAELMGHKEKLRAALDGQQALKDEYVGLSLELIYEFKLRNSNADMSYMGSEAFLESTLARGRVLFESRLGAD